MFKLTFNDAVIFTMQTMIDEINTQLVAGKLTDDERKALSKTRQDCAKTIERTLDAKAQADKWLALNGQAATETLNKQCPR